MRTSGSSFREEGRKTESEVPTAWSARSRACTGAGASSVSANPRQPRSPSGSTSSPTADRSPTARSPCRSSSPVVDERGKTRYVQIDQNGYRLGPVLRGRSAYDAALNAAARGHKDILLYDQRAGLARRYIGGYTESETDDSRARTQGVRRQAWVKALGSFVPMGYPGGQSA